MWQSRIPRDLIFLLDIILVLLTLVAIFFPNTAVTLLMKRKNLGNPFEVNFNREKVTVKSVPYSGFVAEGIGYIKLRSFTRDCSKDIKKALANLKKEQELKGLILDLRSNPGGLLNESINIANIFILVCMTSPL